MKRKYTDQKKLSQSCLGHTIQLSFIPNQLKAGLLPHIKSQRYDCEPCAIGNYRRKFKRSLAKERKSGRLKYETKGQVKCVSSAGHKYFITVSEEITRLVYACRGSSKYEASEIPLHFAKRSEKQSGHTVTAVHEDNGTEFTRSFTSLTNDGVIVTTSNTDTQESNALAEQTHQTIMNDVSSCFTGAKLPERMWHYPLGYVIDSWNTVWH